MKAPERKPALCHVVLILGIDVTMDREMRQWNAIDLHSVFPGVCRWLYLSLYVGFRRWNGVLPGLEVSTVARACVCVRVCVCVCACAHACGHVGFRMWNGVLSGQARSARSIHLHFGKGSRFTDQAVKFSVFKVLCRGLNSGLLLRPGRLQTVVRL